jgi:type II secretory ATPase GspE/PulE/Tfp pilus assembly ATPase PilB-like protein
LRGVALKSGMRALKIGGAQKIADGLTTLEEVYSVLPQH